MQNDYIIYKWQRRVPTLLSAICAYAHKNPKVKNNKTKTKL